DRARMNKRRTPVLRVVAPHGEGIVALVDAITAHAAQAGKDRVAARTTRMLIELALAEVRARLERDADGAVARLSADVQAGTLRLGGAAGLVLDLLNPSRRPDGGGSQAIRPTHPSPLPHPADLSDPPSGEGVDPALSGTLSRSRERVG